MEIIDQLLAVSPRIALVLVLCVIGFLMKRSPLPNWLIPWILLILGGAGYTVMADVKDEDYTAKLIFYNVVLGMLLGAASVGLHSTVRTIFPFLFPEKGETEMIKKNEEEKK